MNMDATALLMVGREGPGRVAQWVATGRWAAARDAVERLYGLPGLGRVIIATPDREAAEAWPGPAVTWDLDPPGEPFHFGRRLSQLLARYPAPAHLYLGAGSLPLLPASILAEALEGVGQSAAPAAVTNNLHSSDWMVFNCPEAAIQRPERLASDNALGWVLKTEAGVAVRSLPASAATRLDIDTPADLLLLGLHPACPPHLRRFLDSQPHDSRAWVAAGRRLFTPGGQAAIIGRVSSAVWAYVEAHTQSWIRVLSEERGMSASGRQAAGRVRSLVGTLIGQLGARGFFAELSTAVEAVLFDTRVVLAHHRLWPSPADRYASDLGLADEIEDDFLRELTAAAVAAPIPVVLGGHGVVSGDLYGLVEAAEAGRLGPETRAGGAA
jgi:hypothetical protein